MWEQPSKTRSSPFALLPRRAALTPSRRWRSILSVSVTLEEDYAAHTARRSEYAAFRASHASLVDAIKACPRPDWQILLAYEAAPNRKEVLALGCDAASLSGGTSFMRRWMPRPFPLEVVDAYSNHTRLAGRSDQRKRAVNLGLLGGALVMAVADRWTRQLGKARYEIDLAVMLLALVALIPLIQIVFRFVVRRRAAALDDGRALEIVLAQIESGMLENPYRVSTNAELIGRHAIKLVEQSK
jgi:hypothetical protein